MAEVGGLFFPLTERELPAELEANTAVTRVHRPTSHAVPPLEDRRKEVTDVDPEYAKGFTWVRLGEQARAAIGQEVGLPILRRVLDRRLHRTVRNEFHRHR